ncbi:MAG TPA: phosphatase PAP2 family protein [Bacillota bacterium]
MRTRNLQTKPFFTIGIISLVLFITLGISVHIHSRWVAFLDSALIEKIQALITPGRTAIIMIVSELGNVKLLALLTVIVSGWLFFKRKIAEGLWFGGTVLFCAIISTQLLKSLFARERPDGLQLITKTTWSFPSGHATGATIFYGFIGLILILLTIKVWKKILIGIVTFVWISFLLATRIYLGVHFPTDVIGGFLFGLASIFISAGVYLLVREPLRNVLFHMRLPEQSNTFKRLRG